MFFNECMKFSSETQYTYRYSNFKGSSDSVLLELNFLPTIYFLKTFNLLVDPFHATGLSLYPLKISENHRFSVIFREYRRNYWHEIGLGYFSELAPLQTHHVYSTLKRRGSDLFHVVSVIYLVYL